MRKGRGTVMIAALAVASLVVGLTTASAGSREVVTLTYLQTTTGQAATKILIDNFQRVYPNIKIEVQYQPTAVIETLLPTQLQAGTAPDVFYTQSGNSSPASGVWPLAKAGRLLDLSGRKWNARIYPPGKPYVVVNGKVYGWPLLVQPYDVLYNVDLFNQLGLKIPTKFADVLSMCAKINAAGKIPFVQALSTPIAGLIIGRVLYSQFVYGADPTWDDKRAKKQVSFSSSPLWRQTLQAFVDMKNAGCFQQGAQGTSRPQQYAIFARRDAVMSITSAAETSNILTIDPNIKIGMFNLPPTNPKNAAVFTQPAIIVSANAATKHPNEVKTFVDFLAREQQNSLFAKVAGGLAALDIKKGRLPDYMKLGLGPLYKAGKLVTNRDAGWPNPFVFADAYENGIIGLFTGQLTIDTVLGNMDRLWDNPPNG